MTHAVFQSLLLLVSLSHNPYNAETQSALRDAIRLVASPDKVKTTRYVSLLFVPQVERKGLLDALNFWVNSLSREADIVRARQVTPTLYAIDLADYGIDPHVYEKLADEDPYFHVSVKSEIGASIPWRGGLWSDGGKDSGFYAQGAFEVKATKKTRGIAAPWLDPKEISSLILATQSATPILRADWLLSRVAIQADRQAGYYDFLKMKNRQEFFDLVAFDQKKSADIKKEIAAQIGLSGVAQLPRQVFRFQSITGGVWQTRDALDNNRDERNALRNLDGDYKHQAEEWYATLPNGLPVYFLSDDKGVRQDSAPDKIGGDTTTKSKDARIHVGLSCVRCHTEVLKPLNDWGRTIYGALDSPLSLQSPDAEKAKRLRIYLRDIEVERVDDVTKFTRAIKACNGLTPIENTKTVAKVWSEYIDVGVSTKMAAFELGVPEKVYLERLKKHFADTVLNDLVLAAHLRGLAIRRDDWEQLVPLVAPVFYLEGKP